MPSVDSGQVQRRAGSNSGELSNSRECPDACTVREKREYNFQRDSLFMNAKADSKEFNLFRESHLIHRPYREERKSIYELVFQFRFRFQSTSSSELRPYCSSKFRSILASENLSFKLCKNLFRKSAIRLCEEETEIIVGEWQVVKCHLQAAELGQTDYFYNLSTGECNNTCTGSAASPPALLDR